MEINDLVQVRRNVGSLGPQWLDGVYVGFTSKRDGRSLKRVHAVRLTDGDSQEIVHCEDDTIRKDTGK